MRYLSQKHENKKKTGKNGCVYVFSVVYKNFDTNDIINIDKF